MKTIGLIGGMSWESSKLYYQNINLKTNQLLGGTNASKSIMISVDYSEIEKLSFQGKWDDIAEIMKNAAQRLEKAGADIVLLCTNTIHIVSDSIKGGIDIPFLHIAEATGADIKRKNLKKVGLLGTKFTMEKDIYSLNIKNKFDVEVIIPNINDRQIIHDIIYNELVKGIFTKESKEKCKHLIERLQLDGAEGIILGCTELPILIPESEINIPSFDTGKIHAEMAVDFAISN